ncbi:MAG TPA: hypothetical protein VFP84_06615 [Kofleriaceae bacterium]|nr:hypothetical protein [Kofleriaceae bacterium]
MMWIPRGRACAGSDHHLGLRPAPLAPVSHFLTKFDKSLPAHSFNFTAHALYEHLQQEATTVKIEVAFPAIVTDIIVPLVGESRASRSTSPKVKR